MLIGIDASRAVSAQPTGTENYSLYLIRALLHVGSAHRFRLYFNRAPAEGLFEQSERVVHRVLPFPRLWTHVRLAWEVLWHPPDVLFVPAHVLPWAHPKRCVVTVHDLGYLYYPRAHTRWARWYLDRTTRFNARAARRIIADSEATRKDLVSHYGVDPGKIVVAYPAGAPDLRPVREPALLSAVQARYCTGAEYFLYVGTLQPRKNLATLVQAFAQAALPAEVRLVLAGKKGWLYEDLLALVERLGLAGRVVLPGYVAAEDLPALLSGALAYVLPSWYEGFGLPVLEAMACETPVLCANASSLPEVAGDAALLIDPQDVAGWAQALGRIYREPALRAEMIARGRARARAFSWQRCAEEVLAVLEAVGRRDVR
jgi:glycosyltransferase involved in cell wall biosynthesis